MRWFYWAIGGGAWPVMRSHVSWCTKAMRVSLLRQKQYIVVFDGEPKCEIMVASSVWKVRHCDLTSHCSLLLLGWYEWGASPCCSALLFGAWHVDPVAICPTCRWQEVHNSWKGASTEEYTTEFMKGSDLVLEKSVFTEYVPTRVYRAHLKNIRFSVW